MSSYRTLFQVDIAHDYFLSRGEVVFEALSAAEQSRLSAMWSVPAVLEIAPDEPTRAVLQGHRMVWRATAAGFVVAVTRDPTANDLRPFIPPAADFRLRFELRRVDPRFAVYTELGPETTGFYRFSNASLNSVAGTCFLSRRVAGFDAARRYVAGETYAEAAGSTFNLFRAVRDSGPAAAPIVADWSRIPADTFDAAASYQAGAVVLSANQVYRARVNNPGGDLSDATVWQPVTPLANQYVTVADASDPAGQPRSVFGLIEIGTGSGDFALFNPDGSLRSPRYALRFLNRATRWRYIFPSAQAVGTGAEVAQEAGDARVLITARPRALTRFGSGSRLQAASLANATVSEEILLPAPEASGLRREAAGWYSETHVTNVTVGT
jgi:hypothetical protein